MQVLNLDHPFIYSSRISPISISLEKGTALAVCGNNGVGKTTFLKLLLGDFEPSRGTIEISSDRYYLGIKNGLKADLLVRSQLPFYNRCGEQFPWLEFLDKQYGDLSSGQQRMFALWLALFGHDEPLIILDEPFSHLDLSARKSACQWINQKLSEQNSIIFTHHGIEDLREIASLKVLDLNLC